MGASIEKSLYIGILKTRFDQFDEVILILKDETEIHGVIEELDDDDNTVVLSTEAGYLIISVSDIKDYK
jgi:hypothetical protein